MLKSDVSVKIMILALSFIFQIGGAIIIGFFTSWVIAIAIIMMFCGHNIEKHHYNL